MTSRIESTPSLSAGIKWSFVGHVVLALLILIKSVVFPGKPLPYIPTLRVDLVGLPDVLKKDLHKETFNKEIAQVLKKAAQKAVPKNEMVIHPKHVTSSDEKSVSSKNLRALERMKSLAKIQNLESSHSAPKIIKGNRLSAGKSLSSDAEESSEANYLDLLRDRLQDNWTLPAWIARQNLSAQVRVFINAQGHLQKLKFVKFSGNAQFDEAVQEALKNSQPFPVPPEALHHLLLSDGILVGFPL